MCTFLENYDEIQLNVATLIERSASLDESREQINVFAHSIYSDNIDRISNGRKPKLMEWLARVEYSLRMHKKALSNALSNVCDEEKRNETIAEYKEIMYTEFLLIFSQLSDITAIAE